MQLDPAHIRCPLQLRPRAMMRRLAWGTPWPPLRSCQMASSVRPVTRELAQHLVRVVHVATDGQPRKWRMLSSIPGATADAVLYAVDQGWLELEGNHSVCLTEEGKRLMAKAAH